MWGWREASPATHHEDEGPQALSQRLAKQLVADVEHLPAAGHQLLLSTHGWGRRRCCRAGGRAGGGRSSSGRQRRVAPFIEARGSAPPAGTAACRAGCRSQEWAATPHCSPREAGGDAGLGGR